MPKFNINDSLDSGYDPLWDDMDMLKQVEKSPASVINLAYALGWDYFRAVASINRLKEQGKVELHEKKWTICSKGIEQVIPLGQTTIPLEQTSIPDEQTIIPLEQPTVTIPLEQPTVTIPLEQKWKPGDSFVENERRGTLIKPVESHQVSNAWLAEVNGYQTIVSLDFIERPPKDDEGQYLLFPLEQEADEPPDPDDFDSEEAYLKAWVKWESTHIEEATEFQRRNSQTYPNVVLRETNPLIPLEQKSQSSTSQSIPLEQQQKLSHKRAAKNSGSGYLRMRECNKKRNAAKGKAPDVYWAYYYSFTDDVGVEQKRSVSVKKSKVNFVQELIDKSTPYHQILKCLNKEKNMT